MSDLYKHIGVEHDTVNGINTVGTVVVMHQILANSCTLSLPVEPYTHDAVVDMISSDRYIDPCMKLDAGGLGTPQLRRCADIVDVIVLDRRENSSHSSDDTGLLAVMDVTAAHGMASYALLCPAVELPAAYCIAFHLSGALYPFLCKVHIILGIKVFSEGNSAAAATVYLAVLDYPAL